VLVLTVPKSSYNPISLPGMGRSIEVSGLCAQEVLDIRNAFSRKELCVEFVEEPGTELPVVQLWANPHALEVTLFI